MTRGAEDIVIEALCDLMRRLYPTLEHDYSARTSDTGADETIAANDWTFTQTGRRFG